MRVPNLQEEKKLYKLGYKRVAGLDEAGRGPLAGPVVAAAVIIKNPKSVSDLLRPGLNKKGLNIKDSKKLSPKTREKFYRILTEYSRIKWAIGIVSERVIDKINILEATKLAMKKAIQQLKRRPDFLILDGNFKINSSLPQKSIIKADEKVFSCAAASILAKVVRDRIMGKLHKKYPKYRFDLHKGYPTRLHFKMLKKYGPCKIHRKTFGPLKRFY